MTLLRFCFSSLHILAYSVNITIINFDWMRKTWNRRCKTRFFLWFFLRFYFNSKCHWIPLSFSVCPVSGTFLNLLLPKLIPSSHMHGHDRELRGMRIMKGICVISQSSIYPNTVLLKTVIYFGTNLQFGHVCVEIFISVLWSISWGFSTMTGGSIFKMGCLQGW